MRTVITGSFRSLVAAVAVSAALFSSPSSAAGQGFGVGGRMAWVTADSDVEAESVRFTGGQIRLLTGRWGLEVAMDRRSESLTELNQKVTETPIQVSLLMRLGGNKVSPFLLGGRGWYRRTVAVLDDSDVADVKSTEVGWHAGGGLEILATRHFGIHGDYRYTFLDFGDDDDDDDDDGLLGGLLPGHRGSMWTVGATFYF